jgi:hypothetical protein
MLGGCAGIKSPASVLGLKGAFEEPAHEILGRTPADQQWIDGQIATGQAVLGWQIKPRPPELDAQPPAKPAPAKPKKRTWRQRIGIGS